MPRFNDFICIIFLSLSEGSVMFVFRGIVRQNEGENEPFSSQFMDGEISRRTSE